MPTGTAILHDLLCTAVYPRLSSRLALKVGGENRLPKIQKRHLERLVGEAGVNTGIVLDCVAELAGSLPGLAARPAGMVEARHGASPIVRRIVALIEASCRRPLAKLAR